MLIKLRDYQEAAVQSIWEYFKSNTGNPCLALPTGTGKSVVIGGFLEQIYRAYPMQKVLVLTHVKELIQQNYDKLKGMWPHAPAGINSSGLKRRDIHNRIVFAGIASVAKQAAAFGKVDLVLVDEAHLISPNEETMYQRFLAELRAINPFIKVIGFTATPWRLGQGKITQDGIFTDICFDMTSVAAFNWLIQQGYLAPLIPKKTELLLDVSGVHKVGGEFKANELQLAVDKDAITYQALQETLQLGADRNHWLIFASGVEHANNIASMLTTMGVECKAVHSKMPDGERDEILEEFKSGRLRAVANNNVLTTGFDFPAIDLIVMLRPTSSTVLWVQMLGRGTRPYDGKENCLVLDFAGNTARLGPINDPVIPRKKGEKQGEAPVRICPKCSMYNHASARYCGGQPFPTNEGCGEEFTFTTKLRKAASTHELIKSDLPVVEVFNVDTVTYAIHNKVGKPPSLKVSYYCGLRRFNEFIHFEIPGWGERKAREWWGKRLPPEVNNQGVPVTTATALEWAPKALRVPVRIRVWTNKPYPEVMAVSFGEEF